MWGVCESVCIHVVQLYKKVQKLCAVQLFKRSTKVDIVIQLYKKYKKVDTVIQIYKIYKKWVDIDSQLFVG